MTLQEQASSQAVLGEEEGAIIELANKILLAAYKDNASDIHLDPARDNAKVRFRLDGVMQDILTLPKNVHVSLMLRVKKMSALDAEETRIPQDGHFIQEHEGHEVDFRVTTLPSVFGPKVTIRLWEQGSYPVALSRLGYRKEDMELLQKCLHSPQGLLIFSGPTGCGKTTIMHSALSQLVSPEITLYSIEDPVLFRLPGVIQMHVNRKVGFTEAPALRAFLRSDPDIIMIGNIPNLETAEMAVEAAISGHLVLAPLHAFDATLAVQRLFDIGVEPFMLSQTLLMVQSQRLVRKICENCKVKTDYSNEMIEKIKQRAEEGGLEWPDKTPTFYKGSGCDSCRRTGYSGRAGLYELMTFDKELRSMMAERLDTDTLRVAAIQKGMKTMFADGIQKAIGGVTTVDEVIRVTTE